MTCTIYILAPKIKNYYFNSQPHKEADAGSLRTGSQVRYFNSQPHKEADISSVLQSSPVEYFNSQPHKEADDLSCAACILHHISTHSLIKRLTSYSLDSPALSAYFNSQPHKEADLIQQLLETPMFHFNSQPHKEADCLLF